MAKPILCLDFDGVIHSYSSGWKGADIIPDPPVDGALTFMLAALDKFDVVIFSSRSNQKGGIDAMKKWLKGHAGNCWNESPCGPGIEDVRFVKEKPPALVTIDDRALTFTGKWPALDELASFKPWNKRDSTQGADARPVAIYQVYWGETASWTDTTPETFALVDARYRRIVCATRDAVLSEVKDAQRRAVFRSFETMCWPAPCEDLGDVAHALTYDHSSKSDRLIAASVISAYQYLMRMPAKRRNAIVTELRKGPGVIAAIAPRNET